MAAYDIDLFKKITEEEERKKFVELVLPQMKWTPNELVLDVGSGPGCTTKDILWPLLQPYGVQGIVGVDCDENMVKESSKNCTIDGKISFQQADIEFRKTFPEDWQEKFDKCFSFFVLQDVDRMRVALKNVNWLLKEGGECCLILVGHSPQIAAHLELFNKPKWAAYIEDCRASLANEIFCSDDVPGGFRTLLNQCGFDTKICMNADNTREFKTADGYMDFMMGIDPNSKKIDADLQDDYRKEMYEKLVKIPFTCSGESEVRSVLGENGVHYQHEKILHVHAMKVNQALL